MRVLDREAAVVKFANATTPMPWSGSSATSLLTSCQ
jgi:hypothetical protein